MAIISFAQCNFLATISEAVPKRILELMNVPGLTRENVASHLQVCIFPYFSIFHNSLWFFPFFFFFLTFVLGLVPLGCSHASIGLVSSVL